MYLGFLCCVSIIQGCLGQGAIDGAVHADFLANEIANLLRSNRALEASVFGTSPMVDAGGSSHSQDVASPRSDGLSHDGHSSGIILGSAAPSSNMGITNNQGLGVEIGTPVNLGAGSQIGEVNNHVESGHHGSFIPVEIPIETPRQVVSSGRFVPGVQRQQRQLPVSMTNLNSLPPLTLPGQALFGSEAPTMPFDTARQNVVLSNDNLSPVPSSGGNPELPIGGSPGLPLGGFHDPHVSSGGALLGSVHIDMPGEHGNPIDGAPVVHRIEHSPDSHLLHDVFPQESHSGNPVEHNPVEFAIQHGSSINGHPGLPIGDSHDPHVSSGGALLGSVHIDMPGMHGNPLNGSPVVHREEHPSGLLSGIPIESNPIELPIQHGLLIESNPGLPLGSSHDPHVSPGGALLGSVHIDMPGMHGNPLNGSPVVHREVHPPSHQLHQASHIGLPMESNIVELPIQPGTQIGGNSGSPLGISHDPHASSHSGNPIEHNPVEFAIQHGSSVHGNPGLPLGDSHDPHVSPGGALLGSVHIDMPGMHGNPLNGSPVVHREEHPLRDHLPVVPLGTSIEQVKSVEHSVHLEGMHNAINPIHDTGTVHADPHSLHDSSGLPLESSIGQTHSNIATLNTDVHHVLHPEFIETTRTEMHVSPDIISHNTVGAGHQAGPIIDPVMSVQMKRLGEMLGIPYAIFESSPTENVEIRNRLPRRRNGGRGRGIGRRRGRIGGRDSVGQGRGTGGAGENRGGVGGRDSQGGRGGQRGRGGQNSRGGHRGRGGRRGRGTLLDSLVQTAGGTIGARVFGPAGRGHGMFHG